MTDEFTAGSQFGTVALEYLHSEVHAHGWSLQRVVQLLQPEPAWRVLDVATGAGHMAYALAGLVSEVVTLDATKAMLQIVAEQRQTRDLASITIVQGDAQALPFTANSFDAVVCRLAAHHFRNVLRFVLICARVLRPGGALAIVDNVVPAEPGRRNQRETRTVASYVNSFEKLRDPGHVRCLTIEEWQRTYFQAGFQVSHLETVRKEIDFNNWTNRMRVAPVDRMRLLVMLRQAPQTVKSFLEPRLEQQNPTFKLTEAIIIGSPGSLDGGEGGG